MISKLRRKFILINMSLVFAVLLVVFGAVCFSSYRNLTEESMNAMRWALSRKADMGPLRFDADRLRQHPPGQWEPQPVPAAVFCVAVDSDGAVTGVDARFVEVTEDFAAAAAREALNMDAREGVLPGLGLRFLVERTPEETRIAFADTTGERGSMLHLLLTSLLVGTGGLTAFFFISLFLARWALHPVEKSWNQQRQFVADASHELKTPLTVILANTGILMTHREDTVGKQIKWIENTREEANRMKKLVDDLLFLAKSDASREPARHEPVNLSDAAWNCLLPFEPVAFERGVEIDSRITPDIAVIGDTAQLKQLFSILLDNACKYAGNKGKVIFGLERVREHALIRVNNTGAPIPPEHLEHIFERFYRVDEARTQAAGDAAYGGYGLGLAIAKSIVGKHKGKIAAESSAEAGTTFTVSLPVPPAGKTGR